MGGAAEAANFERLKGEGPTLFLDGPAALRRAILVPLKAKMSDMEEARKAMIAKRFGGNALGASTGDSGAARKKKKESTKSGGGECL